MASLENLRRLKGFLFDMDGVIYRGNEVVPGAPEFLAALRDAGVPFMFVTNNATTPPSKVAKRLVSMGIPAEARDVINSSQVTAAMLAEERPDCRVFVVGEEGVYEALAERQIATTDDYREADVVVVGLDRSLTYTKLCDAALAIRRGALFVATNTDMTLPSDIGEVPGAGTIVLAVQAATDVEPRIMGKPKPAIFRYALARLGTTAEQTACIGDRPETDILGGQQAGLSTIAVLTGIGTPDTFAALQPPPDWVFTDLSELRQAYFGR